MSLPRHLPIALLAPAAAISLTFGLVRNQPTSHLPVTGIATEAQLLACNHPESWAVANDCSTISQAQTARKANDRGENDAVWNHAAVALGFLTLLSAIAAAYFAKRAADEMKRSADSADESLSTIQDQFAVQTRPYLTIKLETIQFSNSQINSIDICQMVNFENCGVTPAQKVRAGASMKAVRWPQYESDLPVVNLNDLDDFGAIFPNDPSNMRFEKTVSFDNASLSSGNSRIYVIILVQYRGFDINQQFETEIHFTLKNFNEWIVMFRMNGHSIKIDHERVKGRDRAS